jgi:hypothetical protein
MTQRMPPTLVPTNFDWNLHLNVAVAIIAIIAII